MLLDEQKEIFIKMNKITSSGAFGESTTWTEGAEFSAVATYQSSTTSRIAEKDEKIGNWLITVIDKTKLERNDVIRRKSDGKEFKIDTPSSNIQTPKHASFAFTQAFAYEFSSTSNSVVSR